MKIKCVGCDKWHNITPTAMALVIDALQVGDLTRTSGTILCMYQAFTPERVADFRRRYTDGIIRIDEMTATSTEDDSSESNQSASTRIPHRTQIRDRSNP